MSNKTHVFNKGTYSDAIEPDHTLTSDYTTSAIERNKTTPILQVQVNLDGNTDAETTLKILVSLDGVNFDEAEDSEGNVITKAIAAASDTAILNIVEMYFPYFKVKVEFGSNTAGKITKVIYNY